MALTKTRTRTQTALTRLALLIANVHGELALVEGLLAGPEERPDAQLRALRRNVPSYKSCGPRSTPLCSNSTQGWTPPTSAPTTGGSRNLGAAEGSPRWGGI